MKEAFQRVPTPLALRRMRPGGATHTVPNHPNTRTPPTNSGGQDKADGEADNPTTEDGTQEPAKNQGTPATCLQYDCDVNAPPKRAPITPDAPSSAVVGALIPRNRRGRFSAKSA